MTYTKLLKTQAKKQLGKNILPTAVAATLAVCICAVLIYTVATILPNVADTVGDPVFINIAYGTVSVTIIVLALALSPILLGYNRLCYRISKGETADISEMFRYVTNKKLYFKALVIEFNKFCRFISFFILFFIPLYIINAIISLAAGDSFRVPLLSVCLIISVFASLALCAKYFLAQFIFFENEELNANICFTQSKIIYRSQSQSIVKLLLSFFPWYLLLFFVFPLMFIMPYVTVSSCNFAKWSIYNYLRGQAVTNTPAEAFNYSGVNERAASETAEQSVNEALQDETDMSLSENSENFD